MKTMTRNAMTSNNTKTGRSAVNDTARPRLLWNGSGYDSRRMTDAELRDWSVAVDSLDTWYRERQAAEAEAKRQAAEAEAAAVLAVAEAEGTA